MDGGVSPPPKGSGGKSGSPPPLKESGEASFERRRMKPAEGEEASESVKEVSKKWISRISLSNFRSLHSCQVPREGQSNVRKG